MDPVRRLVPAPSAAMFVSLAAILDVLPFEPLLSRASVRALSEGEKAFGHIAPLPSSVEHRVYYYLLIKTTVVQCAYQVSSLSRPHW